jgi:hypothetical protein
MIMARVLSSISAPVTIHSTHLVGLKKQELYLQEAVLTVIVSMVIGIAEMQTAPMRLSAQKHKFSEMISDDVR